MYDHVDHAVRDSELVCKNVQLLALGCAPTNTPYLRGGQLCRRVAFTTPVAGSAKVLFSRDPFEVAKTIIRALTIAVVAIHSWLRSYESVQDGSVYMYIALALSRTWRKANSQIAIVFKMGLKFTKDSTIVCDEVSRIARYGFQPSGIGRPFHGFNLTGEYWLWQG